VSVLVVEPDEVNGPAVVARLVDDGDDVGVIVADPEAGERWRSLGAYVAVGSADDADLIERAGQHARSIVLFDASPAVLKAAAEGARMASASPARIVYLSTSQTRSDDALEESGLEYVLLVVPIKRVGVRRRRSSVAAERVAEAVSAADDLAGEVKLSLNLADEHAAGVLKLNHERK
jgi:hypothetical protein